MEAILQDLRFALRQMRRSRGLFAIATVTLALGIGVNTALFSMANTVFFQPVPGVAHADGLVWITGFDLRIGRPARIARADFEDYRTQAGALDDAALILDFNFTVMHGGGAEQVRGQAVSPSFFPVLGMRPAAGRFFTGAHETGEEPVAVISHHYWQTRLGGALDAIGRTILLNRRAHTIVGVAAEQFTGADYETPRHIWVPLGDMRTHFSGWTPDDDRARPVFRALGRLAPGAGAAQADAELAAIAARIASGTPSREHVTARTYSAASGIPPGATEEVAVPLAIGLAVTALVLLIACANVGNLLLARGMDRRREMGVRLAIGAGRLRLVRQLLTETLALGLVASAGGLLLALWTHDLLASFLPEFPVSARLDARVVLFSAAAAAVVALATGLLPALIATRESLAGTLKASTGGMDVRRARLQSASVVAQVAVSLVLLVMAALFLRSLGKASAIDMGFDTSRHVLAATVDLGLQPGGVAAWHAAADAMLERAAALPGVTAVSLTSAMPSAEWVSRPFQVTGEDGAARRVGAWEFAVRPGFFGTIDMPLLSGRDFAEADAAGAPGVVIVNEAAARRAWPGADPIGQRLTIEGSEYPFFTVVGVARQAAVGGIESPDEPAIFFAHRQRPSLSRVTILVRSAADAGVLASPLRLAIAEVDPQLAVSRMQTMDQFRSDGVLNRRAGAALLAAAGALGLLLATIGIAGGMALSVSQRTREIGVRLALGAAPGQVARHFVRRGMRLALLGIAVGSLLALGASRVIESMLFGISASDVVAYGGVALVLTCVALAACWIPARRVARVDPLRALAAE